ncbi:MAG: GNAT family N-acetyltransferase, partial [Nanoarchaeota archaeon]|nr:GNAT family N-acetyltransferase [Nanoarchaeota archaeon]
DALSNQEMGISYTYLWFYKKNSELVAYITLLADAIRVHGTALGQSFLDKGVDYKTLPALKVGRLCVHKDYRGYGIGTLTTDFAMKKLLAINENEGVGCRFLITDAKKDAIHFYKKMHFEILKEREKGTIPMYYDMIDLLMYKRQAKKGASGAKA